MAATLRQASSPLLCLFLALVLMMDSLPAWGQELKLDGADLPVPAQAPGFSPVPAAPTLDTAGPKRVLPADQAFALDILLELPDALVAVWDIPAGYYLYRKSLAFEEGEDSHVLGPPLIPAGTLIHDEFFGEVEVFYQRLLVRIPLIGVLPDTLDLAIQFQGCAEAGYCYPMQHKSVTLELPR